MTQRYSSRLAACGLVLAIMSPPSLAAGQDPSQAEAEAAEDAEEALQQRLTEREDKRRPLQPFTVDVGGRPLTLGGEIEVEWDASWRRQRDGVTTGSDRALLDTGIEGEAFYSFGKPLSLFAQIRLAHEDDLRTGDYEGVSDDYAERGEMWLYSEDIGGTGLNVDVGRLHFEDDRRWWWDEERDAIRIEYEAGRFDISVAYARELAPYRSDRDRIEADEDRVQRWIMESGWNWAPGHTLQAFALRHDDRSRTEPPGLVVRQDREDESDARLSWWGLRVMGVFELAEDAALGYWFDWAHVQGVEVAVDYEALSRTQSEATAVAHDDVRGHGFDVGINWLLPLAHEPRAFAGYARGSGDPPDAATDEDGEPASPVRGTDHAFRQSGLQANEAGFGGVQRFRHYGVLLDPELSNLRIETVGAGLSLLRSSSVDLVFHRYRLEKPATALRDARIDPELDGQHRDLGREIDLVLAVEEWERVEFEADLSAFRSGDAFASDAGVWSYGAFIAMRIGF